MIKKEIQHILRLSTPLIIANVFQLGMGFVDTIMAGRISALDLAAVAMGSSLWVLVFLFMLGVFIAVSPIIAHHVGANKPERVAPVFQHALWFALLSSIPSIIAVRYVSGIMPWLSIDAAAIDITSKYLAAYSWGMPGVALFLALRFTNEGLGITRPIMVCQIIGFLLNIVGNYIFMFGHLGMPAMGAPGAGVSSAIVVWINAILLLGYVARSQRYRVYELFSRFSSPRPELIREIVAIGFPIAMMLLMEVGMFSTISLLMGKLGVVSAAAHQVAINFASLTFMVPLGFGRAATIRVGNAMGAGDMIKARRSGYTAITMSLAVMIVFAALLISFPEQIVSIYSSDEHVAAVAIQLIIIAGLFQVFDGIQVAANGSLQGMKDTAIPAIITFIAYWVVGIPSGYYFGISHGMGAKGLWWGCILGLGVAAVLLLARFVVLTRSSRHRFLIGQETRS
ncbi:MAG: MATE family efflux transporter [Gammaproteobacteria bacterium]|nr:MATE family efflux transporter [Gammaproteobacteria bacterium]